MRLLAPFLVLALALSGCADQADPAPPAPTPAGDAPDEGDDAPLPNATVPETGLPDPEVPTLPEPDAGALVPS